jgi:hypothetical protein
MSRPTEYPASPLDIPESESGDFRITHRYIDSADVVSLREAYLTGRRKERVEFDTPHRIHELRERNSVWMTDLPIELRQLGEALSQLEPTGKVLVGGLGLGIAATLIAGQHRVKKVDVVELSKDVVNLTKPNNPKVKVIVSDIKDYIEKLDKWSYSCAFIDTWAGTNEGTWWEEVFPLRRAITRKFGFTKTMCWAEDIMLGQVIQSLTTHTKNHWYYRMPLPMSLEDAQSFLFMIGTPWWEKKWGDLYPESK